VIVKQARDAARQWVLDEASTMPGFLGAYSHGSINWLPDDALLAETSDLDLIIVLEDSGARSKLGKVRYQGILLDVSSLTGDQLQSPDQVLGRYQIVGSFRTASIFADPTGRLTELQSAVARDYAKRRWVERRCEDARNNVLRYLQSLQEATLFHDQVTSWLFATGVTTHIVLVAGLRNPTVRKRYLAARELLADYGRLDAYEPFLELLGCATCSRERMAHHLAALAGAFDAAKAVISTPFFFASDISDVARPIAIDGSRDLIERGDHREAVFWIVATYARCQKVLSHDAPAEMREQFAPGFRHLLGDLGIASFADLCRRGEQVRQLLPWAWELAEAIIAANPEIEDG
jgi:hypothetical protein